MVTTLKCYNYENNNIIKPEDLPKANTTPMKPCDSNDGCKVFVLKLKTEREYLL